MVKSAFVATFLLLGAALSMPASAEGNREDHAAGNPAVDWNKIALRTTAAAAFNPPLESRNMAVVDASMYDAVTSITREFAPYAVRLTAPEDASSAAAAVAAAHYALVYLYPGQAPALDADYVSSLGRIADGSGKRNGIALGEVVASEILAIRAPDNSSVIFPYTPGTGPGVWQPTPPAFKPALDPGWGHVTPFLLASGSQFRPAAPYSLSSDAYTRDFNEIKAVGSANSTIRTPEQTVIARFWLSTGTQEWNQPAMQLAVARHYSLSRTARLLAALNMAGADAFIAGWDAKYTYNQWRPITGIRNAGIDGNPDTLADPTWTSLLVTPPFPDYICGHTIFAGAAQAVLERFFGKSDRLSLSVTSASTPGVVRIYTSFREMGDEVLNARVWAGIHWRTSCEVGRHVGQEVGRYGLQHFPSATDEAQEADNQSGE
jgi:hypothetical protein